MITQAEIQKNLKEAIETSGIKQKELAEKLNIKPTQISAYKNGRKMPSIETLANLCVILKVTADEIMNVKIF